MDKNISLAKKLKIAAAPVNLNITISESPASLSTRRGAPQLGPARDRDKARSTCRLSRADSRLAGR